MDKIGNVIDQKWHHILDSILPGGRNWDINVNEGKVECSNKCPGYKKCSDGGPDGMICAEDWRKSEFTSMHIAIVFHAINNFDLYNQNDIADLNRNSQEIRELFDHIFVLKDKVLEVIDDDEFGIENLAALRAHKRVERNSKLAKRAKEIHGYTCKICGFSFEKTYKEIGEHFIEAHHLTPIAKHKGKKIILSPLKDFTVLCSNCHKMIHKTKCLNSIDQFKKEYIKTSTNSTP